jgi:GTP cyclohydrolase II
MLAHLATQALKRSGMSQTAAYVALGFPEDGRDYRLASGILRWYGISQIDLITNSPRKEQMLREAGIDVARTIPVLVAPPNTYMLQQLLDKALVDGHWMAVPPESKTDGPN